LDLAVGKGEQQLPGCTNAKRKWSAHLDERSEHVLALHGRYTDPGVVFADIEVDALIQLVAEAMHRWLGHQAKIERVGRSFAPIQESRAERIATLVGATDDSERC
jgi:hypothetical protein